MRKFILQAINQFDDTISGNAAANVEFNVYNAGGGLADIYKNDGSGLIDQSSPLLTDGRGRYEFYADNGRYSILFVDETIALQNDLTDLAIYEYGSAGARDAASTAEAIAGTSNKLPDTIGVHAAFNQYGLGGRAKSISNVDGVFNGGRYYGLGGANSTPSGGDNPFPTSSGAFSLDVVGKFFNIDGEYTVQTAASVNFNNPSMKFRTISSSAQGWTGWQEIYHSGNTNFNNIGIAGFGKSNMTGVASSATSARFTRPLNSKVLPTSISKAGTFRIVDRTATQLITGIPNTEVKFAGGSSENLLVLNIFNLTGLTDGEYLELQAESGGYIGVNF